MAILLLITGRHKVCQRPSRLSNESHFQAITRVVHEFYHGSTPKACGARAFLYRIMGGHVGDTKETIETPEVIFMAQAVACMTVGSNAMQTHSKQDDDLGYGTHVGCSKF